MAKVKDVSKKGKTRNCLSLDLKIKVIGMLKEGLSERAIAASVKSQVHRISASKETLVQLSEKNVFTHVHIVNRPITF
jgi:hypothetical protein